MLDFLLNKISFNARKKNFQATTLLLKPLGLGNGTELLKNGGTILAFVAL